MQVPQLRSGLGALPTRCQLVQARAGPTAVWVCAVNAPSTSAIRKTAAGSCKHTWSSLLDSRALGGEHLHTPTLQHVWECCWTPLSLLLRQHIACCVAGELALRTRRHRPIPAYSIAR